MSNRRHRLAQSDFGRALLMTVLEEVEAGLSDDADYYLGKGKVGSIKLLQGNVLHGTVFAREETVIVRFEVHADEDFADTFSFSCTCRARQLCGHAVAIAFVYLEAVWRAKLDWAVDDAEDFQYIFEQTGPYSYPKILDKQLDKLFGKPSKSRRRKKGKKKGRPWWREFLETADQDKRVDLLEQAFEDRFQGSVSYYSYDYIVQHVISFPNPVAMLRAFQKQLERLRSGYYGSGLRPDRTGLDEFLESDEALELERGFEREIHLAAMTAWLGRAPVQPDARLDVEWFEEPLSDGLYQLCFELLLTTRKLDRSPRGPGKMRTLLNEIKQNKRTLPETDRALFMWLCARLKIEHMPSEYQRDEDTRLLVTRPSQWFGEWAAAEKLRWHGGGLCAYDPVPARLAAVPGNGGDLTWSLRMPGGTLRPLGGVKLLVDHHVLNEDKDGTPGVPVYVRDADTLRPVDTKGMPLDVLECVAMEQHVPAERLRGTAAADRLVREFLFAEDEETRGRLAAEVPVRPYVTLTLNEGNELELTLQAVSRDGLGFVWAPGHGWRRLANPLGHLEATDMDAAGEPAEEHAADPSNAARLAEPEQAPDQNALSISPRRGDVAAAETWLDVFIPETADCTPIDNGLILVSWKPKKRERVSLLRLWAERPAGVTYYGNERFKEMVALHRPPRLGVRVEPSGVNLLKVCVEMEKEIEALDYADVADALEKDEGEFVRLPNGQLYRRDDLDEYRKALDALAEIGLEAEDGEREVHALQLLDERVEEALDAAAREQALQVIRGKVREFAKTFAGVPAATFSPALEEVLRPYQKQGASFVVWACSVFGGAILADDMGLGKTVQLLAALEVLRSAKERPGPSLVVCPASVAHNWQREAERFTPGLRVIVLESGKERFEHLANLDNYDLVVKNYALTRRDIEHLTNYEWCMVCVDEAQHIKNPAADITNAVKRLKASHRVALSGTPIENRLLDLWSIMDFVVPGMPGSLAAFERRIRRMPDGHVFRLMRSRLRPLMLRRLKGEVAPELPPRIEERLDCPMLPAQRKRYLAEIKKTRRMVKGMDKAIKGKERIQILAALTRLRQICCDPALLTKKDADSGSGKINELLELVPRLMEAGHKVLVFSQFVSMIRRLEERLNGLGVETFVLTGKIRKRKELIERFEDFPEPCVFLISLKAGGTGLNLAAASHVILFDPWWNPAVEEQAIDRTHRIGQDKTVVAYRLVTEQTIEERIIELQDRKRALVQNVLEEDTFNRTLDRADFEYLLEDARGHE